jgi:hypothetical protein
MTTDERNVKYLLDKLYGADKIIYRLQADYNELLLAFEFIQGRLSSFENENKFLRKDIEYLSSELSNLRGGR